MDPRKQALDVASEKNSQHTTNTTSGGDGVVCATYLQARRETFWKFNATSKNNGFHTVRTKTISDTDHTEDRSSAHGDKRFKSYRAKVFASWLIKTYGLANDLLGMGPCGCPSPSMLDVAGGKGQLAIELAIQGHIASTIIDPLIRKHGRKLDPKEAKRIQKASAPHPNLLNTCFNQESFLQQHGDLVDSATLLVGLHPDECTEDIVDVALKHNKNVAVVPCCTFAELFPSRHLANGTPVRTYEQFLSYLLEKDSRLRMEELLFQGKNMVVYLIQEGHD